MTIRSRLLLLLLPPLSAFLLLASFFFYFNLSRDILLIVSSITLLLVIATVFLIADRISKPVRQLNQAALEIAAGDYEANIQVQGPKEIIELAHTLNTMSQCLVEHMSRLKESSLIRERMHGEYECALLLQHYMLQKIIDEFNHPHLNIRLISVSISTLHKGLFLLFEHPFNTDLQLTLFEGQEAGFPGLFQLNQEAHLPEEQWDHKAFIQCQWTDGFRRLRTKSQILFPPFVWSMREQQFIKSDQTEIRLENQDILFLYNSSLMEHFGSCKAIETWLSRVLRHFAEDGLDAIQVMLTNELTFLTKKQHVKQNFKILCLQMKIS